jgi:hypothetical protein
MFRPRSQALECRAGRVFDRRFLSPILLRHSQFVIVGAHRKYRLANESN